ncbi:hypothetical protein KW790_00790 [Candidatus Parcubacteria bacterium]|nr:hypothetical protein [Candidatus Parcubacteria bacterium]
MNSGKVINSIKSKKSNYWKKESEKKLLELFNLCSKQVPAYKDFLTKKGIDPKKIRNFDDFKNLPSVTRSEYLKGNQLQDLCLKGTLSQPMVFTSTSGSTGAPFYFPRSKDVDFQSAVLHELFIKSSGLKKDKSTLVIVGFGMGVWIGGVITYQAFRYLSDAGYPFSILTPGVNKKEIFEAMRNIAPKFDQVILCGYPPFLKDVIDEGKNNEVNWKDFDLKVVFAAEAFSEKFRDYIAKKTGIKNIYRDTMNIYGSADLGTMAEETPLSILIRRIALKNKKLYKDLFIDATRLPTLAQFNPDFTNFESQNKKILVSGMSALPLVRYEIGDNGGVHTFDDIKAIFKQNGYDLEKEIQKAGIRKTITELPFVYIYERTDLSTKLYGAIIYPEYVKAGLEHPVLEDYITGKFTLFTEHNNEQNEYLELNIELRPGVEQDPNIKKLVTSAVFDALMEKSTEYHYLSATIKDRITPQIVFWPYEHPTYFKPGTKQKWVRNKTAQRN